MFILSSVCCRFPLMSKSTAVEPSSKFDQVLRGSALLPGVKIDRESFLRKELQHSCTSEQIDRAVTTTPADAGVPLDVLTGDVGQS